MGATSKAIENPKKIIACYVAKRPLLDIRFVIFLKEIYYFRKSCSICLNYTNDCLYCVCRYKDSHVVTARAAVTVIHPELGCLISCIELQKYSIILLYAEEGCSPGQQVTYSKCTEGCCVCLF